MSDTQTRADAAASLRDQAAKIELWDAVGLGVEVKKPQVLAKTFRLAAEGVELSEMVQRELRYPSRRLAFVLGWAFGVCWSIWFGG